MWLVALLDWGIADLRRFLSPLAYPLLRLWTRPCVWWLYCGRLFRARRLVLLAYWFPLLRRGVSISVAVFGCELYG